MARVTRSLAYYWTLILFIVYISSSVSDKTMAMPTGFFNFTNACKFPVWLGALSNAGISPLTQTTSLLHPGDSTQLATPPGWGGRFWGRTNCSFDTTTGLGSCLTGDCAGRMHCDGAGGEPPATLAEFTLSGFNGLDFYDVSLVDGYNLPLSVIPSSNTTSMSHLPTTLSNYTCAWAGCNGDLNAICPAPLKLQENSTTAIIGCKSACAAFQTSEYCCTGEHSTPSSCAPTTFSKIFKSACPHAYSYAYDDATSTFTCTGGSYLITFCPS